MLTFEEVDRILAYDPDTGVFTWKVARGRSKIGKVSNYVNRYGYVRIGINGKSYQAHRLAWLLHYGNLPDGILDHIDRDKTNNRISNLRIVTSKGNSRNIGIRRTNSTGYTGVRPNGRRYRAAIEIEGKTVHLGCFATAAEAGAAYLKVANELLTKEVSCSFKE